MICLKTYTRKHLQTKISREKAWFDRWIIDGFSLRQLSNISGKSKEKIKSIKNTWLKKLPYRYNIPLQKAKYLIFDGTYFSRKYCLIVIWDTQLHQVVTAKFIDKESYISTIRWFTLLRQDGLEPISITTDGQTQVMRAIKEVWETCLNQRCLYHIQRQSEMWLRQFPRYELAKELKYLIRQLPNIKTNDGKIEWWKQYCIWKEKYQKDIVLLNYKDKVESDIIRAYRMIEHAYPNMFYFLENHIICSTSNELEGYFSHLKRLYRQHAGLRKEHLEHYLLWFVSLKKLS